MFAYHLQNHLHRSRLVSRTRPASFPFNSALRSALRVNITVKTPAAAPHPHTQNYQPFRSAPQAPPPHDEHTNPINVVCCTFQRRRALQKRTPLHVAPNERTTVDGSVAVAQPGPQTLATRPAPRMRGNLIRPVSCPFREQYQGEACLRIVWGRASARAALRLLQQCGRMAPHDYVLLPRPLCVAGELKTISDGVVLVWLFVYTFVHVDKKGIPCSGKYSAIHKCAIMF